MTHDVSMLVGFLACVAIFAAFAMAHKDGQ
jgi:hypothetical protein